MEGSFRTPQSISTASIAFPVSEQRVTDFDEMNLNSEIMSPRRRTDSSSSVETLHKMSSSTGKRDVKPDSIRIASSSFRQRRDSTTYATDFQEGSNAPQRKPIDLPTVDGLVQDAYANAVHSLATSPVPIPRTADELFDQSIARSAPIAIPGRSRSNTVSGDTWQTSMARSLVDNEEDDDPFGDHRPQQDSPDSFVLDIATHEFNHNTTRLEIRTKYDEFWSDRPDSPLSYHICEAALHFICTEDGICDMAIPPSVDNLDLICETKIDDPRLSEREFSMKYSAALVIHDNDLTYRTGRGIGVINREHRVENGKLHWCITFGIPIPVKLFAQREFRTFELRMNLRFSRDDVYLKEQVEFVISSLTMDRLLGTEGSLKVAPERKKR